MADLSIHGGGGGWGYESGGRERGYESGEGGG